MMCAAAKIPANPTVWHDGAVAHIDVRGLEPPQPMVAILALLEGPDTGDTVVAHLDREPIYLYPELTERGWSHAAVPGDAGEVRLRLTRGGTGPTDTGS